MTDARATRRPGEAHARRGGEREALEHLRLELSGAIRPVDQRVRLAREGERERAPQRVDAVDRAVVGRRVLVERGRRAARRLRSLPADEGLRLMAYMNILGGHIDDDAAAGDLGGRALVVGADTREG